MNKNSQILIVDDDHDLRRTICDFLVTLGYSVQQASGGHNALKLMASEAPVLVITDILMPDKEGISTIREIKKKYPKTKIIAMSGGGQFNRLDLLKSARYLGADAALAKPFNFNELLDVIEDLSVNNIVWADPQEDSSNQESGM